MKTSFELVADMNTAFGNPAGVFQKIDIARVRNQCRNIMDEYIELLAGLYGLEKDDPAFDALRHEHKMTLHFLQNQGDAHSVPDMRDALCDIQVFAMGAQHFMGINGDDDMAAVVDGVMTRFIKDDADREATIAKHAALGVTKVYFEGAYPQMVMKSAEDQPEAPKGKFLKSASFKETQFPNANFLALLADSDLPVSCRRRICHNAVNVSREYVFDAYLNVKVKSAVAHFDDGVKENWYISPLEKQPQ